MKSLAAITMWGALLWTAAAPQSPAPAPTPAPTKTVWDGIYTEAQAKRGEALGAQHCSGCHGLDLNSGEPGPWLYAGDFAFRYDGKTMADLIRRLDGMPPDTPGVLGPAATADLAAFVLWANNFPAGKQDLTADVEALQRIRIVVKKP